MPDPALLDRLRCTLRGGTRLRLALLFGSFARGESRPDSDVDIAILPHEPTMSLSDELALTARLSSAAGREVDLVRLDLCLPAIRWRVANEGIVLLAEPAFEAPRFRAAAGIEHAEYEPLLRTAAERFRRRLAEASAGAAIAKTRS